MKKIQWGIIGCGGIARKRMLPGFALAENAQCIAVMARSRETVEAVAAEFEIPGIYTDVEALLACEALDAVYIASPVHCHKEQVFAAAEAGKHILLEKPMGLSVAEAEEMQTYCQRKQVKLGVGFMMRFHGAHQLTKTLLADGSLGKVLSARAVMNFDYPAQAGNWRQTKAAGGGGAMMDVGVHCADILRYMTGLEAKTVSAFCANQVHDYPDVEDACTALLKMENGSFFTVEAGFQLPGAVRGSSFEICTTTARLVGQQTLGQTETGTLELHSLDGTCRVMTYASRNIYTKQIEGFSQAILENTEVPVSAQDGLRAQRIAEAAYESEKTGRHIYLY